MKRLLPLFLSFCLFSTLVACDNSAKKDKSSAGTNVRMAGEDVFDMARSAVDGKKNSKDTATLPRKAEVSDFEKMLRNARVRDTDGDLTDGENALYGVYGNKTKN